MALTPDQRASLTILVAVLVAFLPALGFDFVYDDGSLIADNRGLGDLGGLLGFWTGDLFSSVGHQSLGGYYRPTVGTWFWTLHQLFGLSPLPWHAGSVLWHAGAALLLFHLARRLGLDTLPAAGGALLFALHPLAIQSVAWVSGVTDPMSTALLLGACLLWLRPAGGRAWALVLLFLALLTSERALAGVGVLGLLALLRPGDPDPAPLSRRAPSLAVLLVPVLGAIALRAAAGISLGGPGDGPGLAATLRTAPELLTGYLQLLLWPRSLSIAYPLQLADSLRPGSLAVAALAVASLVAYGWGDRRRLFIVASIPALLAPALVAGLLPPDLLLADRYAYAALGFTGLLFADVLHRLLPRRPRVAALLAGLVLLPLFALHPSNLWSWKDNLALYTRAYAVTPGHPKVAMNLSNELRRRGTGDLDCALIRTAHGAVVAGDWPGDAVKTAFNLGNCLRSAGQGADALAHYRSAAEESGGVFYLARFNLVVTLLELERVEEAWAEAGILIQEAPGWPEAWRLRAVTNVRMDRIEQAVNCYRKLLELAPGDADAVGKLALLGAAPE